MTVRQSSLIMSLVDRVTPNAKRAAASIQHLDATARKAQRSVGGLGGHQGAGLGAGGSGAAFLAGGGRMVLGGLGAYVTAGAAWQAYKASASFDRQLTNIRLTADATESEGLRMRATVNKVAQETATPVQNIVDGLDSLVAAGRSLPEAMDFLPAVARTARAAGADVVDIARTADAMGSSFKIAAGEIQQAFDMAVKGGAEGKFELKDMARYLPSILPLAATRGLKGIDGLSKIISLAQVIRKDTGTAEEAAGSLIDLLGKLDAEETAKRFKKFFGVDLQKELKKGKAAGKDTLDTFIDLAETVTRGDPEKLNKIFADKEARRAIIAAVNYRNEYKALLATVSNSSGEVGRKLAAVTKDAESGIVRLQNAWTAFANETARTASTEGGNKILQLWAKNLDDTAAALERFNKARAEGLSLGKAIGEARGPVTPEDAAEDVHRMFAGESREDTARRSIDARIDGARAELAAERERGAKAQAERDRLLKVAQRYPAGELPAVLRAQYEAASKAGAEADGRIRGAEKNYHDAIAAGLSPVDTPLARGRPGPGWAPGPRGPGELPWPPGPKPDVGAAIQPVTNPVAALPGMVRQSGAEAVAEAERVSQMIQAAFDRLRPVIRPQVLMPSIPGASTAGSYSDNGGRR